MLFKFHISWTLLNTLVVLFTVENGLISSFVLQNTYFREKESVLF